MGVGFGLQQYEESNEATTRGLSTYTKGLVQNILDETDNENELHFGRVRINTTFFGVHHSSLTSESQSSPCSLDALGIQPSVESMGCLVNDIQPNIEDGEPASCSISWICLQVPLNVSGTIDVSIPNIPIQWQSMIWSIDAISRKIRNTSLSIGGKQHLTFFQGILAPERTDKRTDTDQNILCGESTIKLKLTRGFSVVKLRSIKETSAGLQLGYESIVREQCKIDTPRLDNRYSAKIQFSISENIQEEKTTTLLSDTARASLALSLFVSALSILRVVKSVLQKAIDTSYIIKYKKKDLPIDIANRHEIFGRRDDFTKARTKMPLKIPNEGTSSETMQKLRKELQKEFDLKMAAIVAELRDEMENRLTVPSVKQIGSRSRGKFKDVAKVAVVMKKAKDNLDAHHVSVITRKKQREVEKVQAKSRLTDRLQSRSRKNMNRNSMIVPMPTTEITVVTPQEETVALHVTNIDSTNTEDKSTKVIGYLKKMFKSPETLSKYWDKISDSKNSTTSTQSKGKMQKAHFNKLIQTVLKKTDDASFLKVDEDNLLSMLWDSVRNGGAEEEIGEAVLSKWIFGVSIVEHEPITKKKKKKKKKRKTSEI